MRCLIILFYLVFACHHACAAEGAINFHGFLSKLEQRKPCIVTFNINKYSMFKDVDELKKLGIFTDELKQSDLNTKPIQILLAASLIFGSFGVKAIYEANSDLDRCTFLQSIEIPDSYGNDKKIQISSFEFDRSTYLKINWQRFEVMQLPRASINFKFTTEADRLVEEEQ